MTELGKILDDFRNIIAQIMIFKSNKTLYIDAYRKSNKKNIEKFRKEKRPPLHIEHLENVINEQMENHIKDFPNLVYPMSIVYAVTHFEVFMTNISSLLFNKYPESLKTKDKKLSYEEILSFKTMEEIKDQLIQREVEKITYGSINEQIESLVKKFNLKIIYEKIENSNKTKPLNFNEELIEIYSTRNLIIHNNSIVNKRYLEENKRSKYKIGQKLNLTNEYATKSMYILSTVSQAICYAVRNKINKKPVAN